MGDKKDYMCIDISTDIKFIRMLEQLAFHIKHPDLQCLWKNIGKLIFKMVPDYG